MPNNDNDDSALLCLLSLLDVSHIARLIITLCWLCQYDTHNWLALCLSN